MSDETNERDTHFQGFAKLQYPELARLFLALYSAKILGDEKQEKQAKQFIHEFLAKSAYDLVEHTINLVPHVVQSFPDLRTVQEVLAIIPDLTEWPEGGRLL